MSLPTDFLTYIYGLLAKLTRILADKSIQTNLPARLIDRLADFLYGQSNLVACGMARGKVD